MAISYMTRIAGEDDLDAGWFQSKLTVTGLQTSTPVQLPSLPIQAIGARVTGSGNLYFTFDSPTDINANTAIYSVWDGTSAINLAVTGFKLTNTSSLVPASGLVMVKTLYG